MDISKYISIPFKELGRDLNGWDCWGCFRYIYQEQLGISLPSYINSYKDTKDVKNIAAQTRAGRKEVWIKVEDFRITDGILFRIEGDPVHVAIVINSYEMIHVYRGVDTCIENFTTSKWKSRLLGFYRYRGLI